MANNKQIDPNKVRIGDVILVASGTTLTIKIQKMLGYAKDSSKWTHVAGSIGGYNLVEGQIPKSRVCNLQKDYIEKGKEIRVVRKNYVDDNDRIKIALWWATMNNTPYDKLQLAWFPIAAIASCFGKYLLKVRNIFNSNQRLICSELVANGFYKEGYNLFNKPAANVLPADYDNRNLFSIIDDIWL